MKLLNTLHVLTSLLFVATAERGEHRQLRNRNRARSSKSDESPTKTTFARRSRTRTLTLTITNESFNQPFSPYFVMVHNSDAEPLYVRGQQANEPLALLAENGSPDSLVDYYTNIQNDGVLSVMPFSEGAPYVGGESLQLEVEVSSAYPLVTIATMAINTNDCFTALNGMRLYPGQVVDVPGLDAGSEENNESCNSIPGPGCAEISTENVRSGNGEGFVHVHRGFFGIGDLPDASRYDWRNPMMRIVVS
mmetsp:Transcript_30544/g.46272  ORF Transcript_30544/g.46272 Transcript_30544/m.46272 type:complete len:249 (+) Transcript_30544:105-851(+)